MRKLPGKIDALAVGGAGRYLLLRIKDQRRLLVFDAQRADISGIVELADDDACVTANLANGFVAYPRLRVLDRIDLESARLDRSAGFPCQATPTAIIAGSASASPLLAVFHAGRLGDPFAEPVVGLLDPDTLTLVVPSTFRRQHENGWSELSAPVLGASNFAPAKQKDLRASASGDLFCSNARTPVQLLALKTGAAELFDAGKLAGRAMPAAAGRSLLMKTGRFNLAGSTLASPPDAATIQEMIPAGDPSIYLVVRALATPGVPGKPAAPVVEICSADSGSKLFVLNGLDEMKASASNELALDERYHVIPSARLLVTIPGENDRICVRRLDVLGELDRLGIDEVVVTSTPLVGAVAGAPLLHRVQAHAKGGATCERIDGPDGLSVSSAGELRWDVPNEVAGQELVAGVRVRSATGKEVVHKVYIMVRGRE